jgi:hypothetical protein
MATKETRVMKKRIIPHKVKFSTELVLPGAESCAFLLHPLAFHAVDAAVTLLSRVGVHFEINSELEAFVSDVPNVVFPSSKHGHGKIS